MAFDNMERRPISGDGAWERHDVVLDVSPDADSIHFGALLAGGGELRLRALSFEVVSDDTPTTGDEPEYPDEPVNLDLASPISP